MKTKQTPKKKPTPITAARSKQAAAESTPAAPEAPQQRELTPEEKAAQQKMDQIQYQLGGAAVTQAAQLLVQGSAMLGQALIVPLDLQDQAGNMKAGYVVALCGEPEAVGRIAKVVGATIEGFRDQPAAPETPAKAKKAAAKK